MKLTIHIPDDAITDVENYCGIILKDSLYNRIQRLVDKFVANALEDMEQRRRIKEDDDDFFDTLAEAINANK